MSLCITATGYWYQPKREGTCWSVHARCRIVTVRLIYYQWRRSRKQSTGVFTNYVTSDKSNYNKQVKRQHSASLPENAEEYLCDECAKKFRSKFGLQLHRKNKHSQVFKYICSVCDKGYNQRVQFKYHTSSHMNVPMDKCSFCKASFTSHGSLKRHLRGCNKIPEDSYVCDECQSSFGRKATLMDHMKGKHKAPTYVCEICGKRYGWRSSLKAHLRHGHEHGGS